MGDELQHRSFGTVGPWLTFGGRRGSASSSGATAQRAPAGDASALVNGNAVMYDDGYMVA